MKMTLVIFLVLLPLLSSCGQPPLPPEAPKAQPSDEASCAAQVQQLIDTLKVLPQGETRKFDALEGEIQQLDQRIAALPSEAQARLAGERVNLEVIQWVVAALQYGPARDICGHYVEMLDAGRLPSDAQMRNYFWFYLIGEAANRKDAAAMKRILSGIKAMKDYEPGDFIRICEEAIAEWEK